MPVILDLGCGKRRHAGAIGMDSVPLETVDIVHDLMSIPYPFASECANEIILSHVLEHFEFPDIVRILEEVHRILLPEGRVTISVPHAFSIAAHQPQHRTYFCFEYFELFDPNHPFGYYKDFSKPWKVTRRLATVNFINDHYLPRVSSNPVIQKIENYVGKFISLFARRQDISNIADYLVKLLPFWLVSIHWHLQKTNK